MDHMPFAAGDQLQLEPDYADVYQAWKKNPVPETRHAMLKAIDPIIQSGIQAYGGPSSGSPTLYSQARRLALQSFDSYDPAKGGLRSHVLNNLRRLQRLGAQQAQIISLPERVCASVGAARQISHTAITVAARARRGNRSMVPISAAAARTQKLREAGNETECNLRTSHRFGAPVASD